MKHRDFSLSRKGIPPSTNLPGLKEKYQYLEFKHLYFQIQKLLNKRVTLSLKYDQLKSPDIHCTLVKPITERILKLGDKKAISSKLNRILPNVPSAIETPKFGPQKPTSASSNYTQIPNKFIPNNNSIQSEDDPALSSYLIFILLLLKYEYTIQSENNLILFEVLTTKANICELLAIRMLREYKSFPRINLLFLAPLNNEHFQEESRYSFNTLELSVLSKSKRFLSQPVIIRTLDRFYNGELILNTPMVGYNRSVGFEESAVSTEEQGLLNRDVVNYKFNRITFSRVIKRSNIVPKYQSLVLNLKLISFMMLYFILILSKEKPDGGDRDHGDDGYDGSSIELPYSNNTIFLTLVECMFWLLGLNFNIEFLMKILNIEFIFFKKIIWNYVDFILIVLINISFVLKFISPDYFIDSFSLISIILLPRTLSVFNNYKFFNLIISGFKKMAWNLVGLICLFFSLISGFYFSFITLSQGLSNMDILSSMVKIFFGFTPAVWNNLKYFNDMGKVVIMGYLFLIQFIVGSILAIVLSGVFAKVNSSNHEEFNYFKTVNLILYFKTSQLNEYKKLHHKKKGIVHDVRHFMSKRLYEFLNIFKLPVIVLIFVYEKMIAKVYLQKLTYGNELKFYTFLSRNSDYYQDSELVNLEAVHEKLSRAKNVTPFQHDFGVIDGIDDVIDDEVLMAEEENDDISVLLMRSRKNSIVKPPVPIINNSYGRRYSQIENASFMKPSLHQASRKNLHGFKSIGTLRGRFNTASNESLFSNEISRRPIGSVDEKSQYLVTPGPGLLEKVRTNNSETRAYGGNNGGADNDTVGAGGGDVSHPNESLNVKNGNSEANNVPIHVDASGEQILARLKRLEELLLARMNYDPYNDTIQAEIAMQAPDDSSIVHTSFEEMLEYSQVKSATSVSEAESDTTCEEEGAQSDDDDTF